MIFYRVTQHAMDFEALSFCGTLLAAHRAAKMVQMSDRAQTRIEMVDLPATKAVMLLALNSNASELSNPAILSTWGLTERGALVALKNGE